ncbi:DUF2065 domain-containing protein [Gymnodinialimonas ceratoperidinii]|uniref:DUF2065 domain-containing protein n=1 Tax=Gymnodinialimonas ceratoperidinii TaxID=2856823 RepID=A0A8F6TZB7_9RHOB|nr:DUF2065 domain-containing protein [Gymnodinialimonas ceratoperidinii]QXT40924.1 DUF2065 domain-containing protein [Gymnodinialimonas ceratoperidinii]
MWLAILMGLGMVLVIEGLVFALAPSRLEDLLRAMQAIPPETRRLIGLGAVAAGAVLTSWAISLL